MAPPHPGRFSTRDRVWLFLEVAALSTALLAVPAWHEAVRNAETNSAAPWFRMAAVLPWLVALGVLGAVERVSRARPELSSSLRGWVRWSSPLVVLGVAPLLLARDAFDEQPVFLMLLTGATALALEASLRRARAHRLWPAQCS